MEPNENNVKRRRSGGSNSSSGNTQLSSNPKFQPGQQSSPKLRAGNSVAGNAGAGYLTKNNDSPSESLERATYAKQTKNSSAIHEKIVITPVVNEGNDKSHLSDEELSRTRGLSFAPAKENGDKGNKQSVQLPSETNDGPSDDESEIHFQPPRQTRMFIDVWPKLKIVLNWAIPILLLTLIPFAIAILVLNNVIGGDKAGDKSVSKLWFFRGVVLAVPWVAFVSAVIGVKLYRFYKQNYTKLPSNIESYQYVATLLFGAVTMYILVISLYDMPSGDILKIGQENSEQKEGRVWRGFSVILSISMACIFLHKVALFLAGSSYYRSSYLERENKKVLALTVLYIIENTHLPDNDIIHEKDSDYPLSPTLLAGMSKMNKDLSRSNSAQSYDFQTKNLKSPTNTVNRTYGFSLGAFLGGALTSTPATTGKLMFEENVQYTLPRNSRPRKSFYGEMSEGGKYSQEEAILRAKRIFYKLSKSSRKRGSIRLEHIVPYFETARRALEAMSVLDVDGNGDVTYLEIQEALVSLYEMCRDLTKSRRDMGGVLRGLDICMYPLTSAGAILLSMVALGADFSSLAGVGTFTLGSSYIFSGTAKSVFESLIFIFSSRPYNVGDRVYIDEMNLVVKNINLLSTTFLRADGQIMYAPNAILRDKYINNIRRSPPQSEGVEVHVGFETTTQQIDEFQRHVSKFVQENNRDYVGDVLMAVTSIENVNRIRIIMYITHRSNWQDGTKRWQRLDKFVRATKQFLENLDISYNLPPRKHEVYEFMQPSVMGSQSLHKRN